MPVGGLGWWTNPPRMGLKFAIVRLARPLIVLLLVLVLTGTGLATGIQPNPVGTTDANNSTNASITLENQTTNGSALTIQSVTVPEDGFVVIHRSGYLEGYGVAEAIAVSEYLAAGTHENVTVEFSTPVPGTLDDHTQLKVSEQVAATVHRDTNDNQRLDYYRPNSPVDQPYGGIRQPVEDIAFLTVEGSRADPDFRSASERVAIRFANQTAATTLTVESVTLPRGGYVSIHTAAYLPPRNESIESTIGVSKRLAPGTHRNITIRLFEVAGNETNQTLLRDRQTLVAVPRYDTGRTGTFEFVATEGREDPSYAHKNGSLATARATVKMRHPRTATESTAISTTPSETVTKADNKQVQQRSRENSTGTEPQSRRRPNNTPVESSESGPFAVLPDPLYLAAIGLLAVMVLLLTRIEP